MANDLHIGSKLRLLREFHKLTQADVADRLHISPTAYSRIEQNLSKLGIEQAQMLAEVFQVSLPDLISNENPIISLTYKDSVTVENSPGYINHRYENSKDALELMMKAKDNEIASLKDQVKHLQEQVNMFTSMLGDYLKGLKQ